MGKLITGLRLSASRTHVESLSRPRDSTIVLEALSGKLDHCSHTTTAIWALSFISVLRLLSHQVEFLHLITDKSPKMLGFRLICVH